MKLSLFQKTLIFSFIALTFLPGSLRADTRQVQVTGDAEVLASPDHAAIRAGIEHWDRSLNVAKKSNEEVLKKVMALADEFKLGKENISMDRINVEVERKGWNERPMHALEGYYVRRSLTFTLKDLERFDEFMGRLLDAGVNQIYGVDFLTTDLRKYRDTAREMAMKAAQEKASLLAKAVGMKAGKALQIKEETDNWFSPISFSGGRVGALQNAAADLRPPGSANIAGKITVRATVSASFTLD